MKKGEKEMLFPVAIPEKMCYHVCITMGMSAPSAPYPHMI